MVFSQNLYRMVFLSLMFVGFVFQTGPLHGATEWKKNLRFSASLTNVGSAHTEEYPDAPGVGGVESQTSWQLGLDGRFERKYEKWSQEHRVLMRYGKQDREVEEDEIDIENILRRRFTPDFFVYSNGRLRSEFDTFAHPARLDGSAGIGYYLLDSDTWGELEFRFGARWSRKWNPSVDFDGNYEFVAEYIKEFPEGGKFTSGLESYAPFYENDYTVRWENSLLASVNTWLDIEYRFTLYYEDSVGETATKNISRVNLIYYFWKNKN